MKFLLVMLLLAALCCAGCRGNGNQELLERELRTQEDKIYDLQGKVEDAEDDLEKCRRENERLRERAGLPATDQRTRSRALDLFAPRGEDVDDAPSGSRRRETDNDVEVTVPEVTLPDAGTESPLPRAGIKEVRPSVGGEAPAFEGLPEISPPDADTPEGVLPGQEADEAPPFKPMSKAMPEPLPEPNAGAAPMEETLPVPGADPQAKGPAKLIKRRAVAKAAPRKRASTARASNETAAEKPSTARANSPAANASSKRVNAAPASASRSSRPGAARRGSDVAALEISKILTTESGTLIIVAPKDGRDQIKEAAGNISVVMLDPAQAGNAARVGRWDFTPRQLELSFQKSELGHGWYLDLPWPARKPAADQLNLYVRHTSDDGQKVDAQQQFTPD